MAGGIAKKTGATIGVLIIGNEILSGMRRELNMAVIIKWIREMGYIAPEVRVVLDDELMIASAVRELAYKYQFTITSGGIGPTHDDITLRAIGRAFDKPLEEHHNMRTILLQHFKGIPPTVLGRLILLPSNAKVFEDGHHWPLIEVDNCYALPGLPHALKRKLQQLSQLVPTKTQQRESNFFLRCNETDISEWLLLFQERHPEVKVGIYPPTKIVRWNCQISLMSNDQQAMTRALNEIQEYTKDKRWLLNSKNSWQE